MIGTNTLMQINIPESCHLLPGRVLAFIAAVSVLITDPLVTPFGCWVVSIALGVEVSSVFSSPQAINTIRHSIVIPLFMNKGI